MPLFDKDKLMVISESSNADLTKSSLSQNLSIVNYDAQTNLFYISLDKVLFSSPISSIEKVLDAHGYVPNLENVLSCLDSFVYAIHAKVNESSSANGVKVNEYIPCMSFELPRKHKIGGLLQSFYDEIAKYESGETGAVELSQALESESKIAKLQREVESLQAENKHLKDQVGALSEQLVHEKKQVKQTQQEQDSSEALPGNTKLCRVEHVDLKRRMVKVKSLRKVIDIPTHLLDRVPEFKARCLITFDDEGKIPLGVLFFDNKELSSIEKRVADLLVVEGDTFKARDSLRNEFQIQAVNDLEENTIKALRRGMKVLISIADDYVVRFSVIGSTNPNQFSQAVEEQLAVYDIGRNQLVVTELEVENTRSNHSDNKD